MTWGQAESSRWHIAEADPATKTLEIFQYIMSIYTLSAKYTALKKYSCLLNCFITHLVMLQFQCIVL